jgi:hypothetical protein
MVASLSASLYAYVRCWIRHTPEKDAGSKINEADQTGIFGVLAPLNHDSYAVMTKSFPKSSLRLRGGSRLSSPSAASPSSAAVLRSSFFSGWAASSQLGARLQRYSLEKSTSRTPTFLSTTVGALGVFVS